MRTLIRRISNHIRFNKSLENIERKNLHAITNFSIPFEVLDFSFLDLTLPYDLKYTWWSRIYEYPLVLNKLALYGCTSNSKIHNSCWGFQGCHIIFKDELEALAGEVVNSDLKISDLPNTTVYDVSRLPRKEWLSSFDFVLNVSTVEEIRFPHVEVIQNLLSMCKPGGKLIITFDFPGIQLAMLETLLGRKISPAVTPLTGISSVVPDNSWADLQVGILVLERK
jgi:SAM-dependent methyltransferase